MTLRGVAAAKADNERWDEMKIVLGKKNQLSATALERITNLSVTIGFWLLCALTVASGYLGITVAAQRLTPAWAFNVGSDTLGVMVCTLLYYGCLSQKQTSDEATRLFLPLLFIDAWIQFLDLASWLLEGVAGLRWVYIGSYTLYLCDISLLGYQFWRFIRAYLALDSTLSRRCDTVMRVALVPALLVCLTNLFFPLCFFVDAQGVFHETDGSILAYIYLPIVVVCSTLCILRTKAPRRSKVVIALFYIVPVVYAVFFATSNDASLPDAPLLTIILMYVVLVTDRTKTLAATATELNMAADIQIHLLPNTFPAYPERSEFDIYATMDPAKEVGGDFYDFFMVDDDHLAMVVADVSGKGVPAALFSMIAKTMLKTSTQATPSPERVLSEVNSALGENNDDGMFVTVWLGVLEISTGRLTYADAGHERLALYQNGEWKLLPKACGTPLALLPPDILALSGEEYRFRNQTIQLQPGDVIFQYTDGVTEATDAHNTLFGEERLAQALNSTTSARPEELLPQVRKQIDAFVKEAPQFDDITMLALRYNGGSEKKNVGGEEG